MIFKLKKWHIYTILIIAGVILISLIRGCQQSNHQLAKYNKTDSLNKQLIKAVSDGQKELSGIKKAYQDSLEYERGQASLFNEQKLRTEAELNDVVRQNKILLQKHNLAQYVDTTATVVPHGFIVDCEDCFTKLETTTNLSLKYKGDVKALQVSWEKQEKLYKNQFNVLKERDSLFTNKLFYLAKEQQETIDKLKPRGRLYLSWSVLWAPWPTAAGAGLMYQNKRNLIYGVKWYYGSKGQIVETSLNFPLSLNFK